MGKVQYAIIAVLVGLGLLGVSVNMYFQEVEEEEARISYATCVTDLTKFNQTLTENNVQWKLMTVEQRAVKYGKIHKGMGDMYRRLYTSASEECGDSFEAPRK